MVCHPIMGMRPRCALVGFVALAACNPDQSLSTFNRPPEIVIESHADGDGLPEGYPAPFRAGVTDPDNVVTDLWVAWLVDGVEACAAAPPDPSGVSSCDIVAEAGENLVEAEVRDPGGRRASAEVVVVGEPTDAPDVVIVRPDPTLSAFYANIPVAFHAVASDAEDAPGLLVATWESSRDGVLALPANPEDDGDLRGTAELTEGNHLITLHVEDTTGKVTEESVAIRVNAANRIPECGIVAPLDGAVAAYGSTQILRGTVSDPDVAPNLLAVAWRSDKDGPLGVSTPSSDGSVTFPWNGLTVNSHAITMTVTDDAGGVCSDAIVVTVGTAPLVSIASPQANRIYPKGSTVIFAATTLDNEDPPTTLDLEWTSDRDGLISAQRADAAGQATFIRDDLSSGWHELTLSATDTLGLVSTDTVRFKVNQPPGGAEIGIDPPDATTTDPLTVDFVTPSADPDGDVVSYTYRWYRNDVLSVAHTGATVPASDTTKHQEWRVVVTPSDGFADGPVAQAEIVIRNSPPSVGTATVNGTLTETGTLSCAPGTVQDADGDTVTLHYNWMVDGLGVAATTSTLGTAYFQRDDVVTCLVTPDDGESLGPAVQSAGVTIQNLAPSVSNVRITPAAPEADKPVTCAWTFSDLDPNDTDHSTVQWLVDGVAAGTGATKAPPFAVGQTITCRVTPNDGTTAGASADASAVVVPSTPTVTGVTVTPTAPIASSTLTCAVQGFADPQGDADATRYRWTIDGFQVGTGKTLSGAFLKHEIVSCQAIPSDGVHDGAAVSASVTIRNDPPSTPGIAFDPGAPIELLRDLECRVATASTDADADAITYAFVWKRNGFAFSGSTDAATKSVVDVNDLLAGDVWRCEITADDGEVASPVASLQATVLPGIQPQLAVGGRFGCLLQSDGEIDCWGANSFGQATPPAGPFKDITAGYQHACAIRAANDTVVCWGDNASGQRNVGAGAYLDVAAGLAHTCAVNPTGSAECWGGNTYGQATPVAGTYREVTAGDRLTCVRSESGAITCWGDQAGATTPSGSFSAVSAGAHHACAVRSDGGMSCWGFTGNGRTTPPSGRGPYATVGAGTAHTCAVESDGDVVCWGYNASGQTTAPTGPFAQVDGGESNSCARVGGVVSCWGDNSFGQSSP